MILIDTPTYSSDHTYVVRLHRDARPRQGELQGRLEHLASGERIFFASGDALIAGMTRMAVAFEEAQS